MKLSEILNHLGGGFQSADGYLAHCPSHKDTKPSLRVAYSEGGKVLIACRAGCSFSEVVAAATGFTASDLFEVEHDLEGAELPTDDSEIPANAYSLLKEYVDQTSVMRETEYLNAKTYAEKRFGVSEELWNAWQLGHDNHSISLSAEPKYGSLFGKVYSEVERLVVPFRTADGSIKGLQARCISGETKAKWSGPSNPKEGGTWSKTAFFEAHTGMGWLVVAEGPGDAMTAAAAGGVDSLGVRGASMASAIEVIDEITALAKSRTVFLAGDGDTGGTKFNNTLSRALALRNVPTHIVKLPSRLKGKDRDLSGWFADAGSSFVTEFQDALSDAEGHAEETKQEATAKPASSYVPTTDVGLARHILDHADGTIAHSAGLGFIIYDRGAWFRDDLSKTRLMVYSAADALHKLADESLDADTASIIRASANRLLSTREIDKFLIEMAAISAVDIEEFNHNDSALVVNNGVVNLKTGELTDHDPDLLATQRVNFDYDPDAKCDRWRLFLREVFPADPDGMAEYMQRLVGYSITGETSEQCFGILWGSGANGKSVFTNTLSYVFEDLTKVTPFSTFEAKGGGIPNDLAALHGARIVLASEGERGKPMAEAVIKRATGSDKIPARFLRQEFFEFTPKFMLWLATNHKPAFKSADKGLWRRVKMIPWERFFKPEERDHYLESDLRREAEGILAWAVEGAKLWYDLGLEDPAMVIEATEAYKSNSDALTDFIGSAVYYEEGTTTSAAMVYKAYREWAFQNGLSGKDTWGRNTLYNGMDERGYRRKTNAGMSVFQDLAISPDIAKEIN